MKLKKNINYVWPIKIGIITLFIGLLMGLAAELVLTKSGIIVSMLLLLILLLINVIFDMLGIAVAAGKIQNFNSMASKKIPGSKESIYMLKNAEKVSSFSSDVIGDVCGILSGSVGAALILISSINGNLYMILLSSLVSGIIAALTVFGKAIGKDIAISNPEKIILIAGKILYNTKFGRKK